MIAEKTLKSLEFDKILEKIAACATSVPARERICALRPDHDAARIEERLSEIEEADKILYQYVVTLSFAFDDVSAILEKANVMSVLTMGEILKIGRLLKASRTLGAGISKVPDPAIALLKRMANRLFSDLKLEQAIDTAILSETEMADHASETLSALRRKIKQMGETIRAKLYSYVNSASYQKVLQDNVVTVRKDRYVIPVKAEYRSAVPGLIHDQSASGQTFYVEPLAIVEMNNQLKELMMEEEREIERILRDFTLKISVIASQLSVSYQTMIDLDCIFAKAEYAHKISAQRPTINTRGRIRIARGRHPLIDAKRVVPVDVHLGDDFNILLVTGPNTGGKTVSLKLVGLFEVMGMSGLFLPCVDAEIAVFDHIFCDVGDEQSIEQNLSTFSSHIANIVHILHSLNANSLVLLDELGAGTDPTEGAALAVSITDFVRNSRARAMITTHYNELKEYAVVTPGVENASMDFDPVTYNPTYKLIVGTPGASNAILISEKLGLDPAILAQAKKSIENGKVQFENVLVKLEESRRNAVHHEEETEKLLQEAKEERERVRVERERLYVQREKLNENVRKETKRLVTEAMEEANAIVEALRALLDDPSEENLFAARKLRKSLQKYVIQEENEFDGLEQEEGGQIEVGDRVRVKSLKVEGEVLSVSPAKGIAKVRLGKMTSQFRLDALLKEKRQKQPTEGGTHSGHAHVSTDGFSPEINLIGLNAAEARAKLIRFLDKATLTGLSELRIVHGYGTGKLRETVREVLKTHPAVLEFRDGVYGEGERGVTIAKI